MRLVDEGYLNQIFAMKIDSAMGGSQIVNCEGHKDQGEKTRQEGLPTIPGTQSGESQQKPEILHLRLTQRPVRTYWLLLFNRPNNLPYGCIIFIRVNGTA
jgi:hypothetical protein